MADVKPLKRSATGFSEFGASDTVPAAMLAGATVISPSQITADQDNYNPTGFADAEIVRVSFNTSLPAITGLTAWTNGKTKTFVNVGSTSGYFPCEHPDSTAANRIAGEMDWILEPGGAVEFWYDSTSSRVRVLRSTFDPYKAHFAGIGQAFFGIPGSTNASDQPFMGLTQASSGSNGNSAPTATLPGAWELDNGGNAAGSSTLHFAKNMNGFSFFGSAHIIVRFTVWIEALSTSAQRFTSQVSVTASSNTATAADVNNSFGIRYRDNLNSGNWQFFSRDNGGSENPLDTGITAAVNTPIRGFLMIDKARAEQRVFVTDGTTTFQGRNTSNIPNAVLCGGRLIHIKSVGTGTVSTFGTIAGFDLRI